MNRPRPLLSVCIPAFNRARYLPDLLDSIFSQRFSDFDLVVCEDKSPQRDKISRIIANYSARYPGKIAYYENSENLGYDANIRNLVEKAPGEFCFFMGNDDLMCPGALSNVAGIIARHPEVGLIVKSYAFFNGMPTQINQEIRYFTEERLIPPGPDAISLCFRRSGVISGYVVHRDTAHAAATAKFDGTLYYQMHLTAAVLCERSAVFTPEILVLCRDGEPPDFGNSIREKGTYVPGRYTPQSRLKMVGGALSIAEDLKSSRGVDVVEAVKRDYSNYFYVYVRDQLELPLRQYAALCWKFANMGFYKYPLFSANCVIAYVLGQKKFDSMTRIVRRLLGHTPQFGIVK